MEEGTLQLGRYPRNCVTRSLPEVGHIPRLEPGRAHQRNDAYPLVKVTGHCPWVRQKICDGEYLQHLSR